MSHHNQAPLRQLSGQEQQELTRISRSRVTPAAEVILVKILSAVARDDDCWPSPD